MPPRFPLIDALRGGAAAAVALYHYFGFFPLSGVEQSAATRAVTAAASAGHLGVEVFFVISGFVIAMTADRVRFTPAVGARFVARRMVRLAPPYWAMVGVIAGSALAVRAAGRPTTLAVTPGQVAAHLAYLQDLLGYPPLAVVFWTLCIEVQFYLVYAASAVAVAALAGRTAAVLGVGWFALTGAGSAALFAAGVATPGWFVPLWWQFAAGVVAYRAARTAGGDAVAAGLLAGLAGLEAATGTGAAAVVGATAGLLFAAARWGLWGGWLDRTGATAVGRVSYSLYLCHGFVGGLVFYQLGRRLPATEGVVWGLVGLMVVFGGLASVLLYRAAERPAIRWSKRVRVAPRPPRDREPEPQEVSRVT